GRQRFLASDSSSLPLALLRIAPARLFRADSLKTNTSAFLIHRLHNSFVQVLNVTKRFSREFQQTTMDTQSPPPKPHRVSPADMKNPQGAWQEEESLEVYRRKRTQRPTTDGAPEIVRFVKRHPKSTEVVYETVQPRRDGRKEIILLEPVQLRDQSPDSLHDDYSLYRMEEYVDASSDIYTREKEPVYYTVEKSE
ncbi:hypothetical protein OSTOST_15207, partial [Ostertagia ostertagi]